MNRQGKADLVEDLKKRFQDTSVALLTDFQGLKVSDITKLRQNLRKSQAELKVIKNTLATLALKGTEMEGLNKFFIGPTALVTTPADPIEPTKILVKFFKDLEKSKIKAGYLSGKILTAAEIETLSKLPSREEMLSKLLGSMQAPAQSLVNVMSAIPRQLVTVLAAIRDKKGS